MRRARESNPTPPAQRPDEKRFEAAHEALMKELRVWREDLALAVARHPYAELARETKLSVTFDAYLKALSAVVDRDLELEEKAAADGNPGFHGTTSDDLPTSEA